MESLFIVLALAAIGAVLLFGLVAWLLWPLLALSGCSAAAEAKQHRSRADEIDRLLSAK